MSVDLALARRLLDAAVAGDKRGKAGVALRLGVSRALLARVLSRNDKTALSVKLARRLIDHYHVIPSCPATGMPQARAECRRQAAAAVPVHNPGALQLWKACRTCPHQPTGEHT
jgi:hypothetical protein